MERMRLVVPEIRELLQSNHIDELKELMNDFEPVETAEVINSFELVEQVRFFRELDIETAARIFEELEVENQARLIGELKADKAARVVDEMSSDERADLFEELSDNLVVSLLPLMKKVEAEDVKELMRYSPNSAGGIMTTEYASVDEEMNAGEALDYLRKSARNLETIYYIYSVDKRGRLSGAMSLKELVLASPYQKLIEIMTDNPVSVNVDMDQEEVAKEVSKYDFIAIPVVDDAGILRGIVTVDDVMDVMEEETTEDMHKMAAVGAVEAAYFQTSFRTFLRKRAAALIIIFLGELFTGTALRHYEGSFQTVISLVFFIPLILSAGGNSGSQSATLVVRGLAVGDIMAKQVRRVMKKEILMGVALGCILGAIGVVRAIMWGTSASIAAVVGMSLVAVVVMATVVGATMPIILRRIGLDPAVSSAPFIASLVDVFGIVAYFTIARIILQL